MGRAKRRGSARPERCGRGLVALALIASLASSDRASALEASKDALEVAIIISISNYVDWPKGAPQGETKLCVLGESGPSFPAKKGNVTVLRVKSPQDLAGCHVLFFPEAERQRIQLFLAALKAQPIITVSDAKGFADLGGIVEIYEDGSKFRLAVNIDSGTAAGFRLNRLAAAAHRALKNGEWVSLR